MDSLTQIALGAAIGEATVGHKAGKKGALWGAALGTLPDLDVVASLFLDPVASLSAHRAATHSFPVVLLAAPLLAWAIKRLHEDIRTTYLDWVLLTSLTLATHILVDLFTVYGTQIFWPVSNHPFGVDSIFIIDPLYTLPLGLGVVVALFRSVGSRSRVRPNAAGLIISSAYLLWGLGAKTLAQSSFEESLSVQDISTSQIMTSPTPLNTLLWQGLAIEEDTLRIGLVSILDEDLPPTFLSIPRQSHLLEGHLHDRAVAQLMWFSKGWYAVERDSLGLRIADYRFGRSDSWLEDSGDPIFHWHLIPDSLGVYSSFRQLPTQLSIRGGRLGTLFDRALGR
jgi:inner membrane protein